MSRRSNPTVIGGFVVGALALLIAGILLFGSGTFFTAAYPYVMYFDGNVNGLQVGAPVAFRGVRVGTVTSIQAAFSSEDVRIRIPVFVEIEATGIQNVRDRSGAESAVRELVSRGLRAQLQTQSLVTGQLFIQLDFHPEASPQHLRLDPDTELPEIPTVPTTLEEVSQSVRNVLDTVGSIPLEELLIHLIAAIQSIEKLVNAPEVLATIRSLSVTVQGVEKIVTSAETMHTIQSLNATIQQLQQLATNLDAQLIPLTKRLDGAATEVQKLVRTIDEQISPLAASLTATSQAAQVALERAEETFSIAAPDSPLRYELSKTLEELSAAARAVRILAQSIEQQPDVVIRGKNNATLRK